MSPTSQTHHKTYTGLDTKNDPQNGGKKFKQRT